MSRNLAYFNDRFIGLDEPVLSIEERGLQFGGGISIGSGVPGPYFQRLLTWYKEDIIKAADVWSNSRKQV
ncbi:hypothetical protein [Aneurinibacillus aneurinilyticus]|jgi:hypothetical protein|uniref:hypothetical protein n=1 Tax=Aneurinibacillus aneurinilyticus TaxID=1391 RepID=UPI0023F209CB|nr:hypothetical protein [Aneurinibacillus aneurinilyticus]MCI1692619.1 hypothetical protein [Aneurinibacillus aneurinilyticus]